MAGHQFAPYELTHLAALDLGTCLLDENSITEALGYLLDRIALADRAFGEEHAITIKLRWRYAQAAYRHHFFGYDGFRAELFDSIHLHAATLDRAARVLGDRHPLTLKIAASMQLSFREQLDWTLDDFSADLRSCASRCL